MRPDGMKQLVWLLENKTLVVPDRGMYISFHSHFTTGTLPSYGHFYFIENGTWFFVRLVLRLSPLGSAGPSAAAWALPALLLDRVVVENHVVVARVLVAVHADVGALQRHFRTEGEAYAAGLKRI